MGTGRRRGRAAAAQDRSSLTDVVRVGVALDLLHVFALIHDDVMDESRSRRGQPSLPRTAARLHLSASTRGSSQRFGESIAVLVGDLVGATAGRKDVEHARRAAWMKTGSCTNERPTPARARCSSSRRRGDGHRAGATGGGPHRSSPTCPAYTGSSAQRQAAVGASTRTSRCRSPRRVGLRAPCCCPARTARPGLGADRGPSTGRRCGRGRSRVRRGRSRPRWRRGRRTRRRRGAPR